MTAPSETAIITAPGGNSVLALAYRCVQAACVAVIVTMVAAFFHVATFAYIDFAFAGAFGMHLGLRTSKRELLVVSGSAMMFALAYTLLGAGFGHFYGSAIAIPGGFLGMGSLLVTTLEWMWAPQTSKASQFERARDIGLIPMLCLCSAVAVNLAAGLTPITYDRILYVFDLKFGGPPSWTIGKLLRGHSWLLAASGSVYNSLPLGLAACLTLQARDRRIGAPVPIDLRWLSVILGVVGFLLYQVSPAAGPIYLFQNDFPFHVPDLAGVAIQPAWLKPAARNGMPSLHVGWTLLLFWNMRRRNWWTASIAALYFGLTAIATLGFGEHYLADLVVVPALALAIQAVCTGRESRFRWLALAIGAGITLAWLIAFRAGLVLKIPGGAATWAIASVSVALPALLGWILERASPAK